MKPIQRHSMQAVSVAFLFLASCSLFIPAARFGSAELRVEELQNGYFLEILTENPVRDVAAVVMRGNWVIITAADTLLDTASIAAYRSAIVDSTIVQRFPTATQFSVRFRRHVSSAEVLKNEKRKNILISVFF